MKVNNFNTSFHQFLLLSNRVFSVFAIFGFLGPKFESKKILLVFVYIPLTQSLTVTFMILFLWNLSHFMVLELIDYILYCRVGCQEKYPRVIEKLQRTFAAPNTQSCEQTFRDQAMKTVKCWSGIYFSSFNYPLPPLFPTSKMLRPPQPNFKYCFPPPSQSQIKYMLKLNMIWVGKEINWDLLCFPPYQDWVC